MSILISAHQIEKSFGARTIFRSLSLAIESEDRVGLIGPNGAGKSTLLRILAQSENVDAGSVTFSRGLRVGYLEQTPHFEPDASIESAILSGFSKASADHLPIVAEWISRLELNENGRSPETKVAQLSGGWQKRVALARELVREPDVLLLDEPTNHLDVESILWLENFLQNSPMAVVTVTHDRLFLQRVANRILDLNSRYPDGLLSVKGSYADYLQVREQQLVAQQRLEESFQNRLRRETEWLQRGAQARQTKQKARIERAEKLSKETSDLKQKNHEKTAQIEFQQSDHRPKTLIKLAKVSKSYDSRQLFSNLDLLITPQTRLALLGANGSGKSTLIRILTGQEKPDSGTVFIAEQIQLAYFEQHRQSLDPALPLIRAVCAAGDYVKFQDRYIFARSYLSQFLFRPEQMEMPIGQLSGGEQSRLRMAQLMLRPANVLVLDEPTNDLDAETLDVLAKNLEEFQGAVILVTHDRYFLDQVARSILAFPLPHSKKMELESFASYLQWETWFGSQKEVSTAPSCTASKRTATVSTPKRKLSFKEKYEFESMEERILAREDELKRLQENSQTPDVVADSQKLTQIFTRISELEQEIAQLYERWAELANRN